jgi:hypothetical protein
MNVFYTLLNIYPFLGNDSERSKTETDVAKQRFHTQQQWNGVYASSVSVTVQETVRYFMPPLADGVLFLSR